MKKNYLTSIIFNRAFNALIGSFKTQLVLFLFMGSLFSSITSLAQEGSNIIEFNQLSSERSLQKNNNEVDQVKSLVTDLHPSVYLENGEINFYDENPTTAFFDINALNSNIPSDPRFESVKFISIRLTQRMVLNNIATANLSSFPNLKYIFIECYIDCTENQLRNTFAPLNNNYTIIYRAEVEN